MKNHIWPNFLAMLVLLISGFPLGRVPDSKAASGPTLQRLYVVSYAESNGSGASWDDPLLDLQPALDQAEEGTEIWVSLGVYKPTQDGDRSASFHLKNGVKIYGGFFGTETTVDQRVPGLEPSILSGDIGVPEDPTDNSFHVVDGSGTDSSTVLDGFTISAGTANDYGAGMVLIDGSPTLVDVTFTNNQVTGPANQGAGAGLYNQGGSPSLSGVAFEGNSVSGVDVALGGGMYNQSGSPVLRDVSLRGNLLTASGNDTPSGTRGGGLYTLDGSPSLVNVAFRENRADSGFGGGLYIQDGSPTLIDMLFAGNDAQYGGGLYNANTDASLVNLTLYNNGAVQGGGLYNQSGTLQISNSIFWANTGVVGAQIYNLDANSTIQFSLIQNGCPASITCQDLAPEFDPMFFDPAGGDFRLTYNSLAIDAGDNTALPEWVTKDLAGYWRKADVASFLDLGKGSAPIVDLGAYEAPPQRIYVNQAASGTGSGLSWQDAFRELRDAMGWTIPGVDVWVASGVYKPTNNYIDSLADFQLANGVQLYGGFAGGETSLEQRDWIVNETILSGDLSEYAGWEAYTSHVLTTSGTDASALIDGFTISKSYASGIYNIGGSPRLKNLIVRDNQNHTGAGMYSEDGNPTLTNVLFYNNYASSLFGAEGGGMFNGHGSPRLTNVVFWANKLNSAGLSVGAGMYSVGGSPVLTNVTFYANQIVMSHKSEDFGSGFYNKDGNPILNNCIFWGNIAETANQIDSTSTPAIIRNSLVQGSGGSGANWDPALGVDGGGNIDADPQFVVSPEGMLQLSPFSIAIDAGDNQLVPSNVTSDFEGAPRFVDIPYLPDKGSGTPPLVDMGAYEAQVPEHQYFLMLVAKSD